MQEFNNKFSLQTWILIFCAIILQSLSFLSIKFASDSPIQFSIWLIALGFLFMLIRAIVWQIILKHNQLSKVYPFNALVQVVILIFSATIYHEDVTVYNLLGLMLMVFGVVLLGKSK